MWSYDVFVHINSTDTERYLSEIRRVLAPGGVGVIHHVGRSPTEEDSQMRFRSQMNARFFADLLERRGLHLLKQDADLPHHPGDVISVFTRPK